MEVERYRTQLLQKRGELIADARLNAIPWTRVCISCKEKQKL
jgi:RNA polymerase-binding transcription factor DksA